ncbi:hypothetical protein AMECASPLE_022560, partial [Ameca splendens]
RERRALGPRFPRLFNATRHVTTLSLGQLQGSRADLAVLFIKNKLTLILHPSWRPETHQRGLTGWEETR